MIPSIAANAQSEKKAKAHKSMPNTGTVVMLKILQPLM